MSNHKGLAAGIKAKDVKDKGKDNDCLSQRQKKQVWKGRNGKLVPFHNVA